MTNPTATLTARKIIDAHAAGTLTAEAADDTLTLSPLADPSGPDCYPDTTIEVKTGDESLMLLGCWKVGVYMKGPNRHDNGVYIGKGWSFQVDDDDGATHGDIRVDTKEVDGMWIVDVETGESMTGDCHFPAESEEEAEEAADILRDLIDETCGEITVEPAPDADVAEELQRGKEADYIELTDDPDGVRLHLYAGTDAGRPVYTFGESDEVWEDAEDCVEAAIQSVRDRLAAVNVRDLANSIEVE